MKVEQKKQYETEDEDWAFSDGVKAGVDGCINRIEECITANIESKNYVELPQLRLWLKNIWKKDANCTKGEQND